ncbi:MAG: hypothetical protein IJ560_02235 [Alphaproteobacteria bacterium]|nr:hypothetical protein [Alphaproteobacteria bacterium]
MAKNYIGDVEYKFLGRNHVAPLYEDGGVQWLEYRGKSHVYDDGAGNVQPADQILKYQVWKSAGRNAAAITALCIAIVAMCKCCDNGKKVKELNAAKDKIENRMDENDKCVDSLKTVVADHGAKIENTRERVDNLEYRVDNLENRVDDLEMRMDTCCDCNKPSKPVVRPEPRKPIPRDPVVPVRPCKPDTVYVPVPTQPVQPVQPVAEPTCDTIRTVIGHSSGSFGMKNGKYYSYSKSR